MFIHSHKIEKHASQLAQDIETSFMFSSECWVISKAEEQFSPHTHTTRDPKDKYVIGEYSKNAKGSQCFVSRLWSMLLQCPSKNLLIKKADNDEMDTVVYEPTGSAIDSDLGFLASNWVCLGVHTHIHTQTCWR